MARHVDEAVVLPWETFDLNEYLGPRKTSQGYVPAPILLNGEGYCCDHPLNIGGGTSQFGTTIYNAIFWGAYDEVDHKPHSRYISRYPLGIEATLGWKTPNVVFTNDTWTPVIIRTSYTSSSITVEFWGNNGGRTVSGRHSGGRTTITVTKSGDETARHVTAKVTGSATFESGGIVTIKRTIAGPDGTTTETWIHHYIGE
jgi:vancomycin resistance protein YoaR